MNQIFNKNDVRMAVLREAKSLLAYRRFSGGKGVELKGDLVSLIISPKTTNAGRIRLHIKPIIREYIEESVLEGALEALAEEQNSTKDRRERERLEAQKIALQIPAPDREILKSICFRASACRSGIISDCLVRFNASGDASLEAGFGGESGFALEVIEVEQPFVFKVVSTVGASRRRVPAGEDYLDDWRKSAAQVGERDRLAVHAPAPQLDEISLEANSLAAHSAGPSEEFPGRHIETWLPELKCTVMAKPIGNARQSVLRFESKAEPKWRPEFTVAGRQVVADFVFDQDRWVTQTLLDVPFKDLEEVWPLMREVAE